MVDVPQPVDRPRGQSDGVLVVSRRRGRWEVHESLDLLVNEPPPPALVATLDPGKRRDRGERRSYTNHNLRPQPRLFDAY